VPLNNLVTFASNYGAQFEHWNGADVSVNARLVRGLVLQGGFSTGRTFTDNCAIVAQLPELIATSATAAVPQQFCRMTSPFLTQVKGYGAYSIPKVDIQVSGSFQSVPGPLVQATYNAPSALAAQTLGRPLAGGASNVQVNMLGSNALATALATATAGVLYGDRMNQLDLRVGKLLKIGQTRSVISLDIYNALNSNAVLTESNAYAIFRQPQVILLARFAKISLQFDF